MIIDCGTCRMRESDVCGDCVVSALIGDGGILALAESERQAIEEMSRVGLISPIRLVEGGASSVASGP